MINQSAWQAVRDSLIAGDRAKLGDPPTVEQLLAYERGELSKDEADHVQKLLVAYPELARAYATPFPDDDASLPDDVIDRQWQAFQRRGVPNGRVLQFWPSVAAIAATLAIAFAAMLWQEKGNQLQPRLVSEPAILSPDGSRGLPNKPHYTITSNGDPVLLLVPIVGPLDYETYRLDLVRSESNARVWSSEPLRATNSNTFYIEIPSRALPSGTYQVIAYGLRGNAREQIATYTIDMRQPAGR